MSEALDNKLERLRRRLQEMESVAVAFSAGVDSTFLLKVAVDSLGAGNVLAVTARSPSVPADEVNEARRLAESFGAEHVIVDTDEFANDSYTSNPPDRCYHCKTELYGQVGRLIAARGMRWIVSGTNADDLGDWRPGLKAAFEQRVGAPLAEAGLTKEEVRELSERMGLPTFDKPASPCLSSRIPYGQAVTAEKLRVVEAGEKFLKTEFAVRECRVRHYGDFARIEVPASLIAEFDRPPNRSRLERFFRGLGLERIEIDPRGFRSGALNEVIAFGRRQESA